MLNTRRDCKRTGSLLVVAVLACAVATPATAQKLKSAEERERQDKESQEKTLNPRVAEDLLEAYELLEKDEYSSALERINELMEDRGEDMKPFDKASVLQIRGSAHVNLDNQGAAIDDFAAALGLDALPENQQDRLRFNLAQLYFVNERYEDAIRFFEEWMDSDAEVTDTAYFMLGASYYNLEQYAQVVEPIKKAIELSEEPDKRYYDLLNIVYSNLDETRKRIGVLETMVELWPGELSYWRQLSGLYLEEEQRYKSFAALEAAYVNGLVDSEDDIILLAQNYSTFENPHRGANILEREMEAGNVERTVDNLELLSQLWSQAREHRKAIPVLRSAARKSEQGGLSFRLGQALLAEERFGEAERAFETALDKGGLKDGKSAEAWMLLGNARFNQADPGDREQREDADRAFAQAQKFRSTRRQASDWRTYIDAINKTETRQAALEQEQQQNLAGAARQRRITACRAQELAGSDLSEECRRLLRRAEEEPNPGQ